MYELSVNSDHLAKFMRDYRETEHGKPARRRRTRNGRGRLELEKRNAEIRRAGLDLVFGQR